MSLGGEEGGAGGSAREDGVDRARGAVNEACDSGQELTARVLQIGRGKIGGGQQADERVGRCGGRLVEPEIPGLVFQHEVREGAADVAGEPHGGELLSFLSRLLKTYSRACRNAAAAAQGQSGMAASSSAARMARCGRAARPESAASTAATPRLRAGV